MEVDAGIAHNTQSGKVVIGITQVARRINVALSKESIAAEHLLTQRDDRIVWIATQVVDASNGIDLVRPRGCFVVMIRV